MSKLYRRQWVAALAVLAALLVPVQCGILLNPERHGNHGNLDAGALVMDCLWLLVGVIPGVVALVVDFSTGGIYQSRLVLPGEAPLADRLALLGLGKRRFLAG